MFYFKFAQIDSELGGVYRRFEFIPSISRQDTGGTRNSGKSLTPEEIKFYYKKERSRTSSEERAFQDGRNAEESPKLPVFN